MTPGPRTTIHRHHDTPSWTDAIVDAIVAALPDGMPCRLLLSGGTTPSPVYQQLAHDPRLDWSRLELGLVDERWLPDDDTNRNDHLIQATLLQQQPAARLRPLAQTAAGWQQSAATANHWWQNGPTPCLALLGMGNDSHTASLFPGAADLAALAGEPLPYATLDARGCPGAQQWPLRLTLTPAGLAAIPHRLLLLRGADKLATLEHALSSHTPLQHPVLYAMRDSAPLQVHWCP